MERIFIRQNQVSLEVKLQKPMDASMLHALWLSAIKFGVLVQIPVGLGKKNTIYIDVRSLDADKTFDGMVMPSPHSIPPPAGSS